MTHYLMQPTWRCPNQCPYCWVHKTVLTRPSLAEAVERPYGDWLSALRRDPPDIMDIAGGEPLLLGWIPDLIANVPGVRFGLSTNGLALDNLRRLVGLALPNLVALNLSYHPTANDRYSNYDDTYRRAVLMCRKAKAPLHVNVLDWRDNVERGRAMMDWLRAQGILTIVSPYEETDGLGVLKRQGLCCQGGIAHKVIAPDGSTWPCLTALRSPYWHDLCLGNWLDDTVDAAYKVQPCYLDCADYYILTPRHSAGDMWGVQAKPCGGE